MSGQDKMSSARKLLIVDGYNVLRCGELYSHIKSPDWTDDSFNFAREQLINDVMSVADSSAVCIVVFDGTKNIYSNEIPKKIGSVHVVFSKSGKEADQTIADIALKYRKEDFDITVVSNDANVQNSVMGHGVIRMSVREFCRQVKEVDSEVKEEVQVGSNFTTLKTRLNNETLSKLLEIRDKK